ncbi:MAG: shikimate kinase [Acidimicrobiia bacterium]
MSGPHLVLVGLMGAGKTTVGEQCARVLDRPFVDTDDLVEATAHATVPEIFEQHGEARFRELERQAVADVTASPAPLVIACGGGAVLEAASRTLLHDCGVVVWLQAPPSVLEERVGTGTARPLLHGGVAPTLERLAAQRDAMYDQVAHVRVDTSGRSVDEVADAVLAAAQGSDRWSG